MSAVLSGAFTLKTLHSTTEQTISDALGRSVQLGSVRGVSHRGLWLGKTVIPPTEAEALAGQIDAIAIAVDPWVLLTRRELQAAVTLVRPEFFVVLSEEVAWPSFSPKHGTGGSIHLKSFQIEAGAFTLYTPRPDPATPSQRSVLALETIQATIRRSERPQPGQVTFKLAGQLGQGLVQTSGTVDLGQRSLQASLQTQNLPLASLNPALPSAVTLQAGALNSDLSLSTSLPNAAEPLLAALDLEGKVVVQNSQATLGQLSAPVNPLQSTLTFQGQRVTLADTHLQIGPLTLNAAGSLDPKTGYDLSAQVLPVASDELRDIVGDRLPIAPNQPWQWQAQITGSFQKPTQKPTVVVKPDPALLPPGRLPIDPGLAAVTLGMQAQALPTRDWVGPIEGATYGFRNDGAWFTLSDGTVVPPLTEAAYQQASEVLGSGLHPALDRKFFWFLQTNPYVTAIAADLAKGKLLGYRQGSRFDTDRFFLDYFVPVYAESSRAAGLDPGEALWMLDHSLRTLQDPLLRRPDARPITTGSGTVGSFWAGEQLLSMQQVLTRPLLAQPGQTGQLARLAVLKQLSTSTSLDSRRLSSTPELMSKIPNVTFGAEEGAIALALGMMRFEGEGIYPESLRSLAASIEQNELDKHALRTTITGKMQSLATENRAALSFALLQFSDRDWAAVGMGKHLFPGGAGHLTGGNTLSVMVSRQEKAGYGLEAAYQNSRLLLLEMLSGADQAAGGDRMVFAVLKDHAFSPRFWQILAQKEPLLAARLGAIATDISTYRQLAQQGANLHEAFYAALVTTEQDIGVSATLKQAVGFQAHLARLLDQAFAPANPNDLRYRAFRRSLAIYLREAPDIAVYGGTEAALRAYGQETLNVQELIAVDVADAPRIRALARLYQDALTHGLITEWDVAGFQRILLTGALLAAGVERPDLPAELRDVGFPSAQFRRDLLFVVGVEGIQVETTRLGIQAHDYRVGFQPVAQPSYRAPSLNGADPASCLTEPYVAAIALGAASAFVWDAEVQRVMLRRGSTRCPLPADWTALFFPALLDSVPIEHSEAGRDRLQTSLQTARQLEAGIF